MQDLHTKHYKTLVRESTDINRWGGVPCSWIGRCSAAHGGSSRPESKWSLTKIPAGFFFPPAETDKLILKKLYKRWTSQNSQNNFKKESRIGGVFNFQTQSEATIMKMVWCGDRHMGQQSKTQSLHKPSLWQWSCSRLRCWGISMGRGQSFRHMVPQEKNELRTLSYPEKLTENGLQKCKSKTSSGKQENIFVYLGRANYSYIHYQNYDL